MFGPGGVLFLLSHEMLLTWRNFRATGKGRNVRRAIFYTFVTAFLGFGGYWAARILSEFQPQATPVMLGAVGAVFAILISVMLAQALMLITESLYQRGDLDLLLASPVPAWRVLIVRMSAIAINVGLFYLILAAAVLVWLPYFGGWAWLSFAPSILLLTLFSTALGLIVARLLFGLIGPKNTRVVAQILASLIGAAFFISSQIPRLLEDESRSQAMRHLFERLMAFFGDASSLASLPARAAFGVGIDAWIWLALVLALYAVAIWWYASGFAADAAAISGLGSRKRRISRNVRAMRGGVMSTLVNKEWRLLRRDPLLLSQILMQLFYLLPLFLVFGTRLGDEGFNRFSAAGFAFGFVLLVTSLAASLAWLTVSAEDAPDLIASAPVSRDRIEIAKALAAGIPAATLLVPPVLGAAIVVSPMTGFWLLLGGGAAIASTCLIAIWHQTPGNRKQFRRRTRGSLMLNFGRSFVAMGWMGATTLAVWGWPLLAIVPALISLGLLLALHESRPNVVGGEVVDAAIVDGGTNVANPQS
jgi:ABC-2 type transport system permease protein